MSEAYWFGAFRMETPAELPDALNGLGFQPAWIEEVHWVNSSSPLDGDVFPSATRFEWQRLSHPLRLLHFLLNELIHGQRHTLLWMEKDSSNPCHAAVLGSPVTVGRFNLLPEYRLVPLPPATGNWQKRFTDWQVYFNRVDLQTAPDWMVYPSEAHPTVQAFFPHAKRILPPPSDVWINYFAAGLKAGRSFPASAGLWIDETPPHLGLFIERR